MKLSKPSGFGYLQPIKGIYTSIEFMIDNIVILFSQQVLTNCVEKMEFFPKDPRYALQIFSRQSSDYLRHSVLSPKRFGRKEMKIEQKARPPPKIPHFLGGVRGLLNRI